MTRKKQSERVAEAPEPSGAELVPVTVADWTLFEGEGGRWFRDLDLAERAGLKNPRDIRAMIKGMLDDESIYVAGGDVKEGPQVRMVTEVSTFGKGGTRNVLVYYLNKEAAVLVLMRLRTPTAKALAREVARVYVAVAEAVSQGATHKTLADLLPGLNTGGAPALESPGLRTLTVLVTPDMASDWLTHRNERNRPLREKRVERFARDLKRGDWKTTHQGIAFGPEGELVDGQHRLAAIVKVGVPATLQVSYYLTAEDAAQAKLKCDTGQSKTFGDLLVMIGLAGKGEGDRIGTIVKGMRMLEGNLSETMSPDEIRAAYLADRDSIDWALMTLPTIRFEGLHRAAFAYAYSAFPKEIDAFAAMVRNVDAPAGTPASTYIKATIARQLRTGGYGRRDAMLRVLRLLKAHVLGEKGLSKLYATEETLEFFRAKRQEAAEAAEKRAARRKRAA